MNEIKLEDLVVKLKETAEEEERYKKIVENAEKKRRKAHLEHISLKWLFNSKAYTI